MDKTIITRERNDESSSSLFRCRR